jgi:hypothetical protein
MAGERVAPKGKYRVICDANFGGPYWGSRFVGDFDSLDEARSSCRSETTEQGTLTYLIYDDQGTEIR